MTHVALEQHPLALARSFGNRLGESEYGWAPLSWSEPFNVTAAVEELSRTYPEFVEVRNGVPVARSTSLARRTGVRHPDSQVKRAAAYLARYQEIERHRFQRVYGQDLFSPPDANAELGQVGTKFFGLLDSAIHTCSLIVTGGVMSILLFSTVLAFSMVALWQAQRPTRRWLKLLVCPLLASTLIWVSIIVMSLGVMVAGAFTPNTAVLSFLASVPLMFLCAKAPLRLLDELLFKPKPWDGVERRKNRAPAPVNPAPPAAGPGAA